MNRTISHIAVLVLMGTAAYTAHVYANKKTARTASQAQAIQRLRNMGDLDALVARSTKPVVVKVFATWCHACQNTKPHYAAVAAELGDKFLFAEADVDQFEDKAELKAPGVPTFIVYKAGADIYNKGAELGRSVGGNNATGIKTELKRITQ